MKTENVRSLYFQFSVSTLQFIRRWAARFQRSISINLSSQICMLSANKLKFVGHYYFSACCLYSKYCYVCNNTSPKFKSQVLLCWTTLKTLLFYFQCRSIYVINIAKTIAGTAEPVEDTGIRIFKRPCKEVAASACPEKIFSVAGYSGGEFVSR